MKTISQDQLDEANRVFLYNGAKGAATSLVVSMAAVYLIPKYSRWGQTLTIPLKAFFVSSATTVAFVIQGEHALINHDRAQFSIPVSPYATELTPEILTERSIVQKFRNMVSRYKYYILFGTWVTGMSISGMYLYRKKNLTVAQKIVEARMYAQALTLVGLAAVVGISAGADNTKKTSF